MSPRQAFASAAILQLLFCLPMAQGQATTPPPSRQWRKVAQLPPGSRILVRKQGKQVPQSCTLAWIDDATLACDGVRASGTGVAERLTYPIASVASVSPQVMPNDPNRSHVKGALIGAGIGAVAGGLVFGVATESGRAGAIGALLGSLSGAEVGVLASGGGRQPLWRW